MAKKGYEQLVHAIIRPPRARYKMEMLGPKDFTFLGQRFHRDDVELLSSNVATNVPQQGEGNLEGGGTPTCSFLKLQVSIWTRVAETNSDPCSPTRQAAMNEAPASSQRKKTMVVYLHGNASARVEVTPNLSFLLAQVGVFGVVGLDFTGSGKSDGDYVSLGYYERVDLECLIQYLKKVYGGPDGNDLELILWGRSMGASTALMHAGKKSFTAKNTNLNRSSSTDSFQSQQEQMIATAKAAEKDASILKGLVCDSPFASLPILCEELVEKARDQGVVVPGVVVSVALSMIARSVRRLANFNIREITPIDDVRNIEIPALFVVGADDDFITPHHSERLVEAYKRGVTTNLFMCPGGHNDARPEIVFIGIEEFCKQRLSLTKDDVLPVPDVLLPTIHQNPPWAYSRSSYFQAHASSSSSNLSAQTAAEDLGMTQARQDDIQNKIGLMMGGQGN